tara:strand:+ start:128 stop:967 length:840 start_codon:yes stop_codon:yes gene_type:complete
VFWLHAQKLQLLRLFGELAVEPNAVVQPEITIVMPALNEEKSIILAIQNTLKSFDDYGVRGQVFVVNDGSTDRTREVVEELMKSNPRVSLLNHDSPQGVGASFWEGAASSEGPLVSWVPGDNESDPWETVRYIKLLEHVDIVVPFVYNTEVRSWFRNLLSAIYRAIINLTFRVNFNYTNGTVIFRKTIFDDLDHKSKGFFFLTDALVRLVNKGYLFAEVPVRLGVRELGRSKAVSFPSLTQLIRGYIRLILDVYYFKKVKTPDKIFFRHTITAQRYQKS